MTAIPLGTYVPGTSVLHRLTPGWKFLFLIAFILGTSLTIRSAVPGAIALLVALSGYVVARVPWSIARGQLLPPLPILAFIFAFQWWQQGLDTALGLILTLYAAIVAATLLTLTTTVGAMMDACEKFLAPSARFGVPVGAITLALSLTIRLIPLQVQAVNDALAARKARGADNSIRALAFPVVVRSLRRAEAIGDALLARGAGD